MESVQRYNVRITKGRDNKCAASARVESFSTFREALEFVVNFNNDLQRLNDNLYAKKPVARYTDESTGFKQVRSGKSNIPRFRMKKYILIDTMNLAHRAKHGAGNGDIDTKIGLSLHIIFNSIRGLWKKFDADHVVFFFEGHSWRYDHYPMYKANRKTLRSSLTPREQEDDAIFLESINELQTFLTENTNTTVLQNKVLEGDDLISFWIDAHPEDEHTIVSSDSDFIQLLEHDNVKIYDAMMNRHLTKDGIRDDDGRNLEFIVKSDGKLKVGSPDPTFVPEPDWYEFAMFVKYVRGDKSDNVFTAYPRAPLKSTKNRVGIREAFTDRNSKGFQFNNFMLQRWTDENKKEHIVQDRFNENRRLIDLTLQPDDVKASGYETILTEVQRDAVANVGIHFLRYCGQWDLIKLSQYPDDFANILKTGY